MERTLPDTAFLALDAFKLQEQAVTAITCKERKRLCIKLSLTAITRKLLSNSDGRTINTIDEQWLEQQFNG